ncbi:MAG: hypothetical protein MJK12_03040 [Colwellia sp.]|nr:hypothetical protein [Colwellia sp.]
MKHALKADYNIIEDLQERLYAFNSIDNDLSKNEWHLKGRTGEFTLYHQGNDVLLKSSAVFFENIDISPDLIIKLILLHLFPKSPSSSTLREHSDFVLMLFIYMQTNDISVIKKEDLTDIYSYYIMHKVVRHKNDKNNAQIIQRLTPRGGRSCYFLPKIIQRISHILSLYNVEFSKVSNVSETKGVKYLKEALEIISIGEITYKDWMAGGSFNNLTFDYGRHYIEFLQDYYEENYPIALALNHVDSKREDILGTVGYTVHKNTVPMIYGLLTQVDIKENRHLKTFDRSKIDILQQRVKKEYVDFIRPILVKQFILKDETVTRVASMINISIDEERLTHLAEVERLRNILFFILDDKDYPELHKFIKNSNFDITITTLKKIILKLSKEVPEPELPTAYYIKQFVGEYYERNSSRDVLNFVRKVKKAGISCVAAFTGWRKSEFGFPKSAISNIVNNDVIDQYALPYRHNIHWHVFKTQKGTSLDREITQKTYELIGSLSKFHNPECDEPAIYSETYNIADELTSKKVSSNILTDALTANWFNFTNHYKPFIALNEIDKLEELNNKHENLTEEEALLVDELSKKKDSAEWQYAKGSILLRETKKRVEDELPLVSYMQTKTGISVKRHALKNYQLYLQGKDYYIDQRVLNMFKENIPEEINNRISESSDDDLKILNGELSAVLYIDCIYPTPHSFRHMWAEAVFRRFDGDAGWMIRSNFKHVSESMWLAYIANKAEVNIHQQLKVSLVSSLMKNWLRNQGSKTSGKYHTLLKRLFKNTTVTTFQAAEAIIDRIATTDVISVKANPWGYCINRLSTSQFAKCAIDEKANPHNATPELCLGCINFMANISNIDYIIEFSWQHIDLLSSEHLNDIPRSLVDPSISFVGNARKRIAELNPKHNILKAYDAALKKASYFYATQSSKTTEVGQLISFVEIT